MNRDRIIQLVAPLLLVLSLTASGSLLPGILQQSDDHVLRFTNVSVEGAPPFVVLGTAIGAIRGLIVDYLWIKANTMKEKGLFYEAMSDADLITKLQPRFAGVWGFHGHNMAYNISVATNTQEERWEWVNAGIRLVRNKGLRYNPNDLALHRELAFWFSHKIEGVADDAHLYYKRELCKEWHLLLGPPPEGQEERIEWMKEIAEAPESLVAAEQRSPGVAALVERLRAAYPKDQPQSAFALDRNFIREYVLWQAIKQQSEAARIMGIGAQLRAESSYFAAFDDIASDSQLQSAWTTLIAHVRKRVLKDEYNMDPALMYRFTRDLGPIDWRHGSAHSLYWARRGWEFGQGRVSDYDIYITINNDSQQITAMQDMARTGRINYDVFSSERPGRFPEPRWIDVIADQFHVMYKRNYLVRGAGSDRFVWFLQNFMGSAICEWYRAGELGRADKLMKMMDGLFGQPGPMFNNLWKQPLDVFVHNQTFDEYQRQPHLAPRDVSASLRYGFKVGILTGRVEVLRDALFFAGKVIDWFKNNSWNDYTTKYGEGRISDIIGDLEDSAELAYLMMMVDTDVRLTDRIAIWLQTDRIESELIREQPLLLKRQHPLFRALVYDRVMPSLHEQFQRHELSEKMTLDEAFPPPPGLDAARQMLIERQKERDRIREEIKARDPISRSS